MMGLQTLFPDRNRKYLPVLAVFIALLLIPAAAMAIPGSGSFIANDSFGGEEITRLYNVIAKICLGILIIVEGVLFYAIFKFRRTSDDEQPEPVHGHFQLEVGWTLAALVIQIFIGWKSVDVMFQVETEPQAGSELVVEAVAKQWDWTFRYPEQTFRGEKIGGFTADNLVVPANATIELDVTSDDVLHSIWIPELGVKIDAVPGRYNYWWFSAAGPIPGTQVELPKRQKTGRNLGPTNESFDLFPSAGATPRYHESGERVVDYLGGLDVPEESPFEKYNAVEYIGMCTELCGKGHYDMYFRTVAMTQSSFFQWVEDTVAASQSADVDGADLYAKKCAQCHQADGKGTPGTFPPLNGSKWTNDPKMKKDHIEVVLLGSNASSLRGPTEVKGTTYDGSAMPNHKTLNNAEVAAIVNHERTNWGNEGGTVTNEQVSKVRKELGLEDRPVVQAGGVPVPKLKEMGKALYSTCTACHGDAGKGPNTVPNLAGNSNVLGSVQPIVETLVNGQDTDKWPGVKTPVGRNMTDRELSALITYIRTAWGNEGSPVQPPEIKRIREKLE